MCALRIVSRDKILRFKNAFIIIIIIIVIVIIIIITINRLNYYNTESVLSRLWKL